MILCVNFTVNVICVDMLHFALQVSIVFFKGVYV